MSTPWQFKELCSVAKVRVSNVDKKSQPHELSVRLCNYMDAYSNERIDASLDFMEATATRAEIEKFSLRRGDVVITKDSETPDDIGISAVVAVDIDRLVCGYHLALIRPNADEMDSVYLARQLSTHRIARYFAALASGSTRYGLSVSAIERARIPVPEKLEQAKIGDLIEAANRAIEQTEAAIAKQRRIKTGLMQDLLTRGIDEHGSLRSESTHQFKDSPLGRIPVEWEPTSIDSLTKFVTSGSRGWAKYYAVEGDRFLRIGDLTRDHINLRSDDVAFVTPPASSEGKRTAVEAGDVLVSITADLGIIGVIPEDFSTAFVNQHIALARIERDAANPRYVGWYLSSRGGQRQFEALNESGAKAGLNLPTIRNLQVPIPSDPIRGRKEQDRIAAILDKAAKGIEDAMRKKDKLVCLKTAVMQDLLTGKKRVTPLLEMVETQ